MASKTIALNTTPHDLHIGEQTFLLRPEIDSDEWLDGYERLHSRLAEHGLKLGELDGATPKELRILNRTLKEFVAELMEPESAPEWREARLPGRVLTEAMEYAAELYGGGRSERPTGSSGASPTRSSKGGTSGTGASRSKGSTRARGR